jgi:hypothetical protein
MLFPEEHDFVGVRLILANKLNFSLKSRSMFVFIG